MPNCQSASAFGDDAGAAERADAIGAAAHRQNRCTAGIMGSVNAIIKRHNVKSSSSYILLAVFSAGDGNAKVNMLCLNRLVTDVDFRNHGVSWRHIKCQIENPPLSTREYFI